MQTNTAPLLFPVAVERQGVPNTKAAITTYSNPVAQQINQFSHGAFNGIQTIHSKPFSQPFPQVVRAPANDILVIVKPSAIVMPMPTTHVYRQL